MTGQAILMLTIVIGSIAWAGYATALWYEKKYENQRLIITMHRLESRMMAVATQGRKVPDFIAPHDPTGQMHPITTAAQPAHRPLTNQERETCLRYGIDPGPPAQAIPVPTSGPDRSQS